MKHYKVLLCDEEEKFVLALMNYVNRKEQVPVLVMAFTKHEEAREFLREHKPDLIITGWERSRLTVDVNIPFLRIVEEMVWEQDSVPQSERIFKYSSAPEYVRKMMQLLHKERHLWCENQTGICIGVYSPIGRCGTTFLAHELCKTQVSNSDLSGKQCIYLGWENYAEEADSNCRMEELLYYIKQRTDNISMKMNALAIQTQGYDQIPNMKNYQELRELNMEDLQWLFECVQNEAYYDALIADIGSGSLADLRLLDKFHVIYMPYHSRGSSLRKVQQFIESMKQLEVWDSFAGKTYPILMDEELCTTDVQRMEEERRKGTLDTLETGGDRIGRRDLQDH
ncbi:MAG: hypothetical protein IJ040_07575 [Lachnospiraceae bacterium]|nr:hypothetical protein [Lachnospiraceae bacterium]